MIIHVLKSDPRMHLTEPFIFVRTKLANPLAPSLGMTITQLLNVMQQGPFTCRSFLPPSKYVRLYEALVCGLSLPDGEERQLFIDSGLIHIMVVSGAHLIFLENLIKPAPRPLQILFLTVYSWLTGFGPPIVKALIRRLFEPWLSRHGWSSLQIEAFSVTVVLTFVPMWIVSRSFLMSWLCALAFQLPRLVKYRALDVSAKTYVLLFVFCAASPLTIFWNSLVAPLVGDLLFPLTLVLIPVPWLTPAVDKIWQIFLWILSMGPQAAPNPWFFSSRELFWIPLTVHGLLLVKEVRWRRAYAFS
jgi:hypothetical protein